MGRRKLSGDARRPTTSASEKLMVAHVARIAPRSSSEKDCMTCTC